MKSVYSTKWKSSAQARKQRKYRYNAPFHIKTKHLSAALSKELKAKYNRNSLPIRSGDVVKVMRGGHKGKEVKVERVDKINLRVYLEKIRVTKSDGSEVPVPLNPSNLMLTQIITSDKKRMKEKRGTAKKAGKVEEKSR